MWGQAARVVLNEPPDVHGEVALQVVGVGFGQARPSDVACVVDHDVDTSERLDRRIDEGLGPRRPDTSLVSADRLPSGVDDLGGDRGGRFVVVSVAFPSAPEVVDDDAGAPLGEEKSVGPSDTASGSGDGGDTPVEVVRCSPR